MRGAENRPESLRRWLAAHPRSQREPGSSLSVTVAPMNPGASVHAYGDRLARLRDDWPRRISWAEVRAAEPGVFRGAAWGGVLMIPALALVFFWTCLNFEWPISIQLVPWLEWMHGFLVVVVFWAAIATALFGLILLNRPSDLRRELTFRRFAERRELTASRYGEPPKPRGIYFTEGAAQTRGRQWNVTNAGEPTPMFTSHFALARGWSDGEPELQIAVSGYSGGKNDPKGPRSVFRYLVMKLPRSLPHLMIDGKKNGSLRQLLPGQQLLSFEGDFDRHFAVYVPDGYARDALELLTPDVMAGLIDYGRNWDIEVVEDRLVVVSHRFRRSTDRSETTAMLLFSEIVGADLVHQAATYTDPRADRPRFDVAGSGRRLRRRSQGWTIALFVGIAGILLGFPFVLGWLLDR